MRYFRALALAAALAAFPTTRPASAAEDDAKKGVDEHGYIASWVILAPIALEEDQPGDEGLAKEQLKDEAELKPKAGEEVEVGGKKLSWKEAQAKEGALDFNDILGEKSENSVVYAVSYLTLEDDVEGATLKLGSDDQVRVYLNGKLVHSHDEGRALEKDEDSVEGLALKKGCNVLVLKVVNEGEDWGASARFVDKEGEPIKGITATPKPE